MIRRNWSQSGPAVLIREGLASRNRDKLLLSVKFGALRDRGGCGRAGAVSRSHRGSV